jgi:hypothetical protein
MTDSLSLLSSTLVFFDVLCKKTDEQKLQKIKIVTLNKHSTFPFLIIDRV